MINFPQVRCAQLAGSVSVLCAVALTKCAAAEVLRDQWPPVPVAVAAHLHEDADLIPSPVLPPEAKAPGSDPFLGAPAPSQAIRGTLAYFAQGWDGEGTSSYTVIVLRSFGGSRLLPLRHLGPPGSDLRSDLATYGFHEGEFDSGNPQFSPDGHVLAYEEMGNLPRYGGGTLIEWDMVAGLVRQLTPRSIAYSGFYWSPDGQSIAYVTGGEQTRKPAQLWVVQRRTLQNQAVILPPGVSVLLDSPTRQQWTFTPIAWASPTSVLLTGTTQAQVGDQFSVRPDIYEATNGQTRLVASQAYAPSPSPDGRWLACFGWAQKGADELKGPSPQAGPNIYLIDRHTGKRFFVRALLPYGRREDQSGNPPPFHVLRWTPNSRRLILTEETYQVRDKAGEASATLSTLDVPSPLLASDGRWARALSLVTTFHLDDAVATLGLHFGPLQMSTDNIHLFMRTVQATKAQGEQTTRENTLQRINLSTGQSETLARFNNERLRGFDWHEEPK